MILMAQIFDVIANENARYRRNELESFFHNYPTYRFGSSLLYGKKIEVADVAHCKKYVG